MIERSIFEEEHEIWRSTVKRFMEEEIVPYHEAWEKAGQVPRELWRKAGEAGLLCCTVPEEYGGLGLDYLFDVVVFEELWRVGASAPGFLIHTDLVATYLLSFGTDEQKKQWLPKMVTGEAIGSLGMSEPHAGSDLKAIRTKAVRDGDAHDGGLFRRDKKVASDALRGGWVLSVMWQQRLAWTVWLRRWAFCSSLCCLHCPCESLGNFGLAPRLTT